MSRLNEFARVVNLPPIMFKYTHLVAEEQEMEWVLALDGRAMNAVEIAKMMSVPFEAAESFLARAVRRAVMDKGNKDGSVVYSSGTFYRRLTYLSMQDNDEWRRVPWEDRRALLDWHLQENILHHDLVCKLALLKQDPDSVAIHNRDILLLTKHWRWWKRLHCTLWCHAIVAQRSWLAISRVGIRVSVWTKGVWPPEHRAKGALSARKNVGKSWSMQIGWGCSTQASGLRRGARRS